MPHTERRSRKALGVFHVLIGIGALGGGFGAIMDPTGGAMGISTDVLRNSPFDSFLIPGLFLFIVIGLFNVIAGVTAWRGYRYQAYVSGVLCAILSLWIIVQVYMMWAINYLHVIYFFVGVAGVLWAALYAARDRLFPFSVLEEWHKVSDV